MKPTSPTSTETALAGLRDRLGLRHEFAHDRDWSAAPDFLALIVEHALAAKPVNIIECGSGLTTLMLARCCALNAQGEVCSLEHGPEFAMRTRAEVARHDLARHARVIDAALTRYTLDAGEYAWYALDDLPDNDIDMLVIDGPPDFLQRNARYPALPLLFDKLAEHGVVFLDDAGRGDEREIVAMWQARFPDIHHEFIETERGCSILRRH